MVLPALAFVLGVRAAWLVPFLAVLLRRPTEGGVTQEPGHPV